MPAAKSPTSVPPRCVICGAGATYLCEARDFPIWRCGRCCVDFVWPPPDPAKLHDLYDRAEWFEAGEIGGYADYDGQTDPLLPFFEELLARFEEPGRRKSILDVGCGYGTHLAAAARRGWECFGVEVSEHARKIAEQRHGGSIFLADSVEHLLPHEFDLILLFDVIEHVADPAQLLFPLFSKGAITRKTTVAITTPNGRSYDAMRAPAEWTYRHPPSHLVYYSGEALTRLLRRLHFDEIAVSGAHPVAMEPCAAYADESSALNSGMADHAGVLAIASGSDFAEFMHERYVPGTWSKLTEYEHMPRYVFARSLAGGLHVLDFGCGSGYGSAMMAEEASSVLGVDIDESALAWAGETHRSPRLRFERRDDLGAGLPEKSFDLITCFEVIEHVNAETQIRAVRNFARLLKDSGRLLISTPNPAVTALYGENPYHLREMTEAGFLELLRPEFKHVQVLRQFVHPGVVISAGTPTTASFEEAAGRIAAAAYVAVCSHEAQVAKGLLWMDATEDYIRNAVLEQRFVNQTQFKGYQAFRDVENLSKAVKAFRLELENTTQVLCQAREELAIIKSSRLYRLSDTLRNQPLSLRKIVKVAYLLGSLSTPQWLRRRLRPLVSKWKADLPRGNEHFIPPKTTASSSK